MKYTSNIKELGVLRAWCNGFDVMEIKGVKYVKQLGQWKPCN